MRKDAVSRRRWLWIASAGILSLAMTIRSAYGTPPILRSGSQICCSLGAAIGKARSQNSVASRLVDPQYVGAFGKLWFFDDFNGFDAARWDKGSHALGRGRLDADNVDVDGGDLTLRLPAKKYDGAEILSKEQYKYGEYAARMRCPQAAGSVSAFFLYQDAPSKNDEVDIEIRNDGSRRVEFSTWVGGKHTNYTRRTLSFDPSAGYHEYRISFHEDWVSFYVDERHLQKWTSGLPAGSMRVMSNAWWPTWLSGSRPKKDSYTRIDDIRYTASST